LKTLAECKFITGDYLDIAVIQQPPIKSQPGQGGHLGASSYHNNSNSNSNNFNNNYNNNYNPNFNPNFNNSRF
jgi:hypothetical protein